MSRGARRGSLLADLGGALAGLGLLGLVASGVTIERRDQAAQERRAAALETAQNLFSAARAGQPVALPPGWTSTRRPLADGLVELRLRAPGIDLATLLPAEGR